MMRHTRLFPGARLSVLAIAAGGLALAACAPTMDTAQSTPAAEPRECFFTRNVNGFSAPSDRTLYLRVGVRDVYEMEMFGPCPEMDWARGLAIESRGGSTICRGMDATIISPGVLGAQRCPVRAGRKLSDVEAAALPPDRRP